MKIAIVTPSFNQGEFIERTIQSVLSQDFDGLAFEYVVMDGGSTDQTVSILQRYENQLKWISERDKGQAHAVNKGLQATTSDIIGWLNSDDIYYPDTIKKVCAFFAANPDIDIVYGDANFIDRDDKVLSLYPTERWNLNRFQSRCFISQPATFFRRRVVEKYGLIDEQLNFCMDYEYWLRAGLSGAKIAYLPGVLAATRIYPQTKTESGFFKANLEAIAMLKRHLKEIPAEWVVSYCGVQVKAKYGYSYPQIKFIGMVWLNLWKTTAEFKQGVARLSLWAAAQYAMLAKFLRRAIFSV